MGLFTLIRAYKGLNALNEVKNKREGKLKHMNEMSKNHSEALLAKEDLIDIYKREIKVLNSKLSDYESWYQAGRENVRSESVEVGSDMGETAINMLSGIAEKSFPGSKRYILNMYKSNPEVQGSVNEFVNRIWVKAQAGVLESVSKGDINPADQLKKMKENGVPV